MFSISDVLVSFVGGAPQNYPHNHSVCNLFNNISKEFVVSFLLSIM